MSILKAQEEALSAPLKEIFDVYTHRCGQSRYVLPEPERCLDGMAIRNIRLEEWDPDGSITLDTDNFTAADVRDPNKVAQMLGQTIHCEFVSVLPAIDAFPVVSVPRFAYTCIPSPGRAEYYLVVFTYKNIPGDCGTNSA